MAKNPPWARDELILALDLYFRCNPSHTNKNNLEVVALSNLLNTLPIHEGPADATRFRNPNGVYMKLCNFLRLDPDYEGSGLTRGSKLEEEVWEEFAGDRERLAREAEAIRGRVAERDYPIETHSWKVLSPVVAVKEMDRSSFVHGGSGIPKEIRWYFDVEDLSRDEKREVLLLHRGVQHRAHFHLDVTESRARLFWGDFSEVIQHELPEHYSVHASESGTEGSELVPRMRFERVGKAAFEVSFFSPAEVTEDASTTAAEYTARKEGGKVGYYSTRYERNPVNRRLAIEIHGLKCTVCGFDFEAVYGPRGAGYIEVHHLEPLHDATDEVLVDPNTDLTTLCSNCHRMIHRRRDQTLSPDELAMMLEKTQRVATSDQ